MKSHMVMTAAMISESSKANKEKCNIAMMLKQDVSEFEGIALKQERNFVADITEKPVYAEVEIEQMREVFDNILMNSIKYSRKNTDIIVTLLEENDNILIKVSNMTDCIKSQIAKEYLISFTELTMQEIQAYQAWLRSFYCKRNSRGIRWQCTGRL